MKPAIRQVSLQPGKGVAIPLLILIPLARPCRECVEVEVHKAAWFAGYRQIGVRWVDITQWVVCRVCTSGHDGMRWGLRDLLKWKMALIWSHGPK